MLLVYHWSSGEGVQELLVSKPVSNWSPEDVALWLEHLGPWAALYRDSFDTEQVNCREGDVIWRATHTHTHTPAPTDTHTHTHTHTHTQTQSQTHTHDQTHTTHTITHTHTQPHTHH